MHGNKLWLAAVTGLMMFTCAGPALAVMSAANGWYLEGNVGGSRLSGISFNGSTKTSGLAGNADVGYKFMPFFGMEIGYTRYSNISIKDQTTDTKAGNGSTYSIDLAGRGIIPIGDSGLEGFAKIGVSRISTHVSLSNSAAASNIGLSASTNNTTSLYLAIGGAYNFTPDLAANLQWAQAQGNSKTGTGSLASVGMSYNFG